MRTGALCMERYDSGPKAGEPCTARARGVVFDEWPHESVTVLVCGTHARRFRDVHLLGVTSAEMSALRWLESNARTAWGRASDGHVEPAAALLFEAITNLDRVRREG